jgi:beta-lactamase superfamily II metal-dependent hydrolase
MACEIEFLPVGDGTRAGDAIVIRYGEPDDYKLMVVDGGTTEAGENLVAHLRKHFGKDVTLEHVVLTHSDSDHASGLREVLREIPVSNFWLHVPWLLSDEAIHLFKNKNWTKEGLAAAIKKEYDIVAELLELATEAKCECYYPFQGSSIGPFVVLSPSRATYTYLLPQFDKTPDPDQAALEQANMWIGKPPSGLLAILMEKAAKKIDKWITESWEVERLKDGGVTSASNESSVVLYANYSGQKILLTGDAGINALTWAKNFATKSGYTLKQFDFVQIPHHGSRRNVGPSILNDLIGPILPKDTQSFTAFVSAPKDDENHPRKIVLNAFIRRGAKLCATQGSSKVFWGGFPVRPGYSTANLVDLSPQVEDYE